MILPDVNLLLYAIDEEASSHRIARNWLQDALSGSEPVAFAWVVLLAFIRLSTSRRVFANPLSPAEAFDIVEGWLAQPCSVIVEPTTRHLGVWRGLVEPIGTAANLTTDAHLAAIAIEHGAQLVSADRDFGRFPGLRWANPLE